MSHPLYNPYASGDQSSTQRQCELSSISAERDPRRAASHFGPGSSFSSSGASSSIPTNSRGMLPPLMSQSASYKPEQSRAIMDEDIERTIDMHISRAREGVRLLSNPMHQPIDQGTHFTTTQRDEFHSSGTGLASFPVSSTSASQGRRHLDEESSSSSVDWSSSYNRTTPDDSSFYSSSSSSNCASGGDGRFNAPGKRDHEMQSISGLGNYDSSVPDRPTSSTESNRPKYTFESAANILQQFGLEKEDLEELISYPEDQITPANLPFILRQIRLRKTKRDTTEVELNPYPELQPNRNQGGMDSHNLSTSGGAGMCQEAMSSAVLQPSKVIDYGHSAKYTGGTGDEIGRTSGSRAGSGGSGNMLLMDTYDSSRHSQELLQKNTTEVKSSAFGSSREQTSSVTGLSSSYSSVLNTGTPPIHNQTKRLQTQPNQTAPSKEPEADRQSTLKTQPQCTLFRGVHPSRPGLVLIGSNDGSGTRDDSKTQGQGSAVAEQMKKQQSQQRQKQVASQTGQAKWPPAFSAAKSVPPAPFIPSVADASGTMQQPVFIPGAPRPIVIPPALPQPIPALMTFNHMTLPTSNRQPPATMSVSKGLPTAAMMHDYAAASPKIFPRTCSLCSKECAHMKDWLSHQNTSLHLQSCKLLRARVAGKGAKPSASTSAQTSQHHHQETRHGSYSSSHSDSPGRRHSSEGRREKRSSRSRSPHSSRYIRRSRSRSHSPWYDHPTSCRYQSRSGSPERRSSPRRRDERRSPPRRRDERRSPPRRSDERRSPPRRVDERRSPPRRVDERRSPPRRSDERRSPPRRVDERRSPPRRSDERRSPQRRNDERRSPPRRVDERRSPPRRFDERRSPPRRVDERRSPPRRVDERRSPPRRVDERRSPARRVDERRSPLRRVDERRSPPRRVDERRSPPRRVDERRSPLRRSDKRRSPPRGSHESQLSSEGSSLTQKSIKAAKLAKKLLQSSVIKCLSNESDLDDVVKTLAPALVAELTKIKSSSSKPSSSSPSAEAKRLSATVSSSSSSCRAKKGSTTQLSKVKPILQKSVASSSTTKKSGKTSPPTMVRLEGIQRTLSHNDVITAVEHFGKTKSVVLFRSKLEALVCFEKEEDAQKLTSMVTLIVKGTEIRVVGGKETVTKQQKKPTEKEPDTSSVSKLQNAPKSEITKVPLPKPNMPQLKESLPSAAKKATKGKLTNQKVAAKGSVKGPMTVAKSKVLVSKAKNISTKQVAKKVKTGKLPVKGTVKKVVVKQKASSGCKSTADDSEQKAEQNKTKSKKNSVRQSVVVLKETAEGDEREKVAASEAQHQAKPAEDAEPMELGEAGGEVAEPMEDGSCAEGEDKKPTATEAVPENSADKPKETGPPASTVETRSTEDSTKASPRVQESTLSESESTAPGSKSTAPENQPESVVVLKETAEGDVSSERTVTEPAEDRKIVTEAKVLVSKAKMVSSTQEPQTPVFKLAAEGAVKKEKVEQPPAKAMIVPGVETSSPEELETKVEEGVVVQKETAEVVETPNVTTSEPQQQAKLAEDAEPMELGEGGVEVAEPMEDGSCAEGEGKKPTTTEAVPENSADKPKETGPPASTVETGSEESCVKASPQIQESTLSEPESTAPGSKPTAPENQPESVVVLKETAAGDESSQRTVTEPAEGREIVTEAKVLVSKAEMVSSTQEPQTPMFKLAAEGAVKKEKVEQPPAKATIMPDVKTSSPEEFETKVEEGVVVQKETAEVVETPNVTTSEPQQQAKLAEDAEPMELGEGGVEVAEPMEDGSCAEGEGKKTTTTEAVPENSADKPKETGPPASTVETGSTEDSSKASPRVQQSTLSEPGPEAKTEASQVQQQAAAEAKVETRTMQDGDAAGAVKTQTDAASAKNSSVTTKPTAAVVRKQQPAASTPSPTAGTPLTVGEMVEKHLHRDKISCLSINFCLSPRLFQLGKKLLLITGLPKYHDGCYTEDDIVKLLTPFGFQHTDENIYVVPQTCMAFVMMPSVGNVQKIIEAGMKIGIFFKGAKLLFSVVDNGIEMTPFGFYQSLMKRMNFPVLDDGLRTVFIRNISPSEVRDLQEALKKISFVKNFLPLLNKVFIEFAFIRDADRLGVWYSLLKKAPGCNVHRLKIPVGSSLSQLPKLPENALPDSKDILAGATIPPVEFGVPQGSISPFWVTMRTRPFLFPTISPWFIIPNYLTVKVKGDIVSVISAVRDPSIQSIAKDIVKQHGVMESLYSLPNGCTAGFKHSLTLVEKAGRRGSKFSTIMLTGLPGGNYEHEDVAKLVQPYFPKWSFHSVYYSLVVLPLQRRAFVFFADWASCCNFVRDHMKDRFSVKGSRLCVHFILQDMNPGSSEEVMYKSLMKWSNTGVPESKSLEERLLCVEISETSVDIVGVVMEAVASIATVVGFLPLANRICVEMADSSGVKQVVEKCKTFCQNSEKHPLWTKVTRLETLKSLKLRLQGEIATESKAQPPPSELSDNGSQPGLQTSDPFGSTMSEPVTAGPSAAASSDASIEVDAEKSGTEIVMDSTVGPEPNKDVEESLPTLISTADLSSASAVSSRNTVPAASSPAPSAAALIHKEGFAELLPIDPEIFKVLTAAVRQHRLSRASRSHSEAESPSKNNTSSRTVTSEDTPQRMGQDDFRDDAVSSDTSLVDEQNFSLEDFVTVDEVGEDVKDTRLKPYHSSSSSPRVRRERQSSGMLSGSKHTSTRSSRDSKSAASSSSSSSKSTKGLSSSSSNSVSPKKATHSSEPTKLPTKPSSSAKPSSSSPPSSETISLPGQKTQQSKTKSPSKASNTASPGRSTLSSSTTHEREKITSAAAVEASTETHLEPLREGAKATEGAVAKSDHKVSAESNAAETLQAETKMGTEMHPPPPGHGEELSQGQSQEIDLNVSTINDQKKSEEDVDKHTEEEEDGETYQILDSFDDQTDEQMEGSSETQRTGPEEGQTLHKESYQDLDSADNKGNAHPEEDSDMEVDGSFQVLDSVAENQEASSQEDSCIVQDDRSTAKQVSEEDATPVDDKSDAKFGVKDAMDKDQETNNKDNFQVLDKGSTQAPRVKGDGKKKSQKEEEDKGKILIVESCKASKDVEDPDSRIPDEDQPHQNRDFQDDLKDLDGDVTEPDQEMFEILDSIDDHTAKDDDSQKFETPSDQMSKEDIGPIEEQEHMYQVIDSVEDQPTTTSETDNKDKRAKKGEVTPRKDDGPSKRSRATTIASKGEEKSPKKEDRTVKRYQTRKKMDTTAEVSKKDKDTEEATEEVVYKIVDSVGDELVQDGTTTERSGRRRSVRGRKEDKITLNLTETSQKPVVDEEAVYEILDSVEEETADDEPTVPTKSTRRKRERTSKKDALIEETKKENTSTRRRPTPARESQEGNREKTPKKEEKAPSKHSTPTKKSDIVVKEEDATNETLDSVEDKVVKDDRPAPARKRGRPRKEVKTTKRGTGTLKKADKEASETVADEEEVTYQILDSVEDETVDHQHPTGQSESSRRENVSQNDDKQTDNIASLSGSTENEVEEEEPTYQIVDSLEDDQDELTSTEVSDRGRKEKRNETPTKEEASAEKGETPTCGSKAVEESEKMVVQEESLYQIVDDLKEAPDDPSAAEESGRRNKDRTSPTGTRRIREGEERKQRSRRSSRGGDRAGTRKAKERGREREEKVEVDSSELVTLDEVGADEAREEGAQESRDWDGEITEGELQALVTLDEFVEEEEDGKVEGGEQETRPLSQEDESVDSLNPETLVTLDEAAGDEEEKPDEEQAEKTSSSAKRKHIDTEESMNFVTVDEVGEEEEEEKEVVATRTRGQARKRARPTPVRRSARGKKVNTKHETEEEKEPADVLPRSSLDASSSLDKDLSMRSSDGWREIQKTEVEAVTQADVDGASAGQELQPERPENQTLERCVEEGEEEKSWSRMDSKAVSQQRRELVGPEAKRSRSQSPCVAADFALPPFKPNTPLGHCSSQRPNDNLQPLRSAKRKQRCKQQNTRRNSRNPTTEVLQGEEKTKGMHPARPPTAVGKGKAFNAGETMMDNMGLTPDQKSVFKPGHDDELEAEVTWYRKDSDLESSEDLQSPPPERGRIQLFDDRGEKLQDGELADPNNWSKIAILRPGRVPTHSPFRQMSFRQATEIKSQSRMLSCFAVETPAKPGDCSDVRATLYDHCQGPWAEIEELVQGKMPQLVAYLVAQPAQTLISPRKGYYYNHPMTKSITKTAKNVQEKAPKRAKE